MFNISGFGLKVSMIASNTFPVGILLTNFSDDQNAIELPDIDIADTAGSVNGELVTWSKFAAVKLIMSVIPDSPTDLQLAVLLSANRVSKNKVAARDIFQCGVVQGNNNFGTFVNGVITSGPPFNTIQSSGRMSSKKYTFTFEQYYAI